MWGEESVQEAKDVINFGVDRERYNSNIGLATRKKTIKRTDKVLRQRKGGKTLRGEV